MIQMKLSSRFRHIAFDRREKGFLLVHNRKYVAESPVERRVLERLFESKMSCSDVENVIHMVFEIVVMKVREQ